MKGFDAEFRDLDHYIRLITERIWEGGRTEDIRRYYGDPCIVETPMSVSTSIEDVVGGTYAAKAVFPDRRILDEDVIQSGNETVGYLSSHRGISTMTHLGDGIFGPPTGRRIHARTVADCVCIDNRIVHEWLVRDQAWIALQIGTTPRALGQRWLNERGGWSKPPAGPVPAPYFSHISQDSLATAYAVALAQVVHGGALEVSLYDRAVQQFAPGGAIHYGPFEAADFWSSVFGALRTTHFTLEHLAAQRDMAQSGRPDRVALRFRVQALHEAPAASERYGAPSGRPVELLGIVHAEFVQAKVVREWVLLDDVATWMQVLTAQS